MAVPVVESFATAAPGGGGTTVTCNAPASIAVGDLLVALVSGSYVSGSPAVSLAGWTLHTEYNANANHFAILSKVAASEPASYEFGLGESLSARRVAILRISGAGGVNVTPSQNSGSGTTATGTAVTTTEDDCLVLLGVRWGANSDSFTPSNTAVLNINRCGVGRNNQATAGSTGSITASITSGAWLASVVAIEPSSGPINQPPTITANTADEATLSTLAELEFTGSDAESDDLRYQVQISDREALVSGSNVSDSYTPGSPAGIIHPNPSAPLTWQGEYQVDDRPGQSFVAAGGILDRARVMFNKDADTDGHALVRIYAHQGTFGTSSEPLNAADPADTPTPGWLAESEPFPFDTSDSAADPVWREFVFAGANRIRLHPGEHYVLILDWIPANTLYDNTIRVQADSGLGHAGNCYLDGNSIANNGVRTDFDLVFEVYEQSILLDKTSGTDAGFSNTITPADTDPFTAGEMVRYTVQAGDELEDGATYFWRVRASDPGGSTAWSDWTAVRSFAVVAAESDIVGSLDTTLDDASLSSMGETAVSGSCTTTLDDAALVSTGSVAIVGQLVVSLDEATAVSGVTLDVVGTAAVSLEDAGLEANIGSGALGTLSLALEDATLASTALVLVSTATSATLDGASLEASGEIAGFITGNLAAGLDDATLYSVGGLTEHILISMRFEITTRQADFTMTTRSARFEVMSQK